MSEAEFDLLLDAVRTAVASAPNEDFMAELPIMAELSIFDWPSKAANDNQLAWPLVPFPEGWYASC